MIKEINYHPTLKYIRIEPKDKDMVPVLLKIFKEQLVDSDLHNNSKSSVYIKADYTN